MLNSAYTLTHSLTDRRLSIFGLSLAGPVFSPLSLIRNDPSHVIHIHKSLCHHKAVKCGRTAVNSCDAPSVAIPQDLFHCRVTQGLTSFFRHKTVVYGVSIFSNVGLFGKLRFIGQLMKKRKVYRKYFLSTRAHIYFAKNPQKRCTS